MMRLMVQSYGDCFNFIIPFFEKYPILGVKADKCFRTTLNWLKLSNSGDILKLMVPNYSWKTISGWSNYSGMVISHKMSENEMGYRGSKSANMAVKEQRVDGSWLLNKLAVPIRSLRCTLMDFERNYQVRILTKQLTSRTYSTLSNKLMVNPWFITGFSDAESSFAVQFNKNKKKELGKFNQFLLLSCILKIYIYWNKFKRFLKEKEQ
jgi:hypothetical protein